MEYVAPTVSSYPIIIYHLHIYYFQAFLIPQLPPSFLLGCNIIDIQYIIQVIVTKFQIKEGNIACIFVF